MRTNFDLFADRGDPWNLPDQPQKPRSMARKRTHKDGFIEWTVCDRDHPDDEHGPNLHHKPHVVQARYTPPAERSAVQRRVFNSLCQMEAERERLLTLKALEAEMAALLSKF